VRFAWQDLGLSAAGFGFLLVLVALGLFGIRVPGKAENGRRCVLEEPLFEVLYHGADHSRTWPDGHGGRVVGDRPAGLPVSTSAMLAEIESARTTWSRRKWPTG